MDSTSRYWRKTTIASPKPACQARSARSAAAPTGSLVKLLGKPTYEEPSGDDKTHIEWVLLDDEGRITTLYSWKWESVQQVKDHCHEWNMGGHDDGMYRDMEDWLEVKGLELLAERNRIMKRAK